ncbi:hypothetical protein ACFX16_013027 [Malus domestica]
MAEGRQCKYSFISPFNKTKKKESRLVVVDQLFPTYCLSMSLSLSSNEQNFRILMNILENYCHASGQRINYTKSSIFLSQNFPIEVTSLVCYLFKIAHSDDPGRYLGIPLV